MKIKGVKHSPRLKRASKTALSALRGWLWRVVDEYGVVLDILLQEHRDTEAAKTFFNTLLDMYETVMTPRPKGRGFSGQQAQVAHPR